MDYHARLALLAGMRTMRTCLRTKTCCAPSGRTRVRQLKERIVACLQGCAWHRIACCGQHAPAPAVCLLRGTAPVNAGTHACCSLPTLFGAYHLSNCAAGMHTWPSPPHLCVCSLTDDVALSGSDEEGGRRRGNRGGARMQRQGSGRGPGLPRSASGLQARHNVITAFNPITQVGSWVGIKWVVMYCCGRLASTTAVARICCCMVMLGRAQRCNGAVTISLLLLKQRRWRPCMFACKPLAPCALGPASLPASLPGPGAGAAARAG